MTKAQQLIQDYDFIFVFQQDATFQLDYRIDSVTKQLQDKNIKWKSFKKGKKWYLVIGFQGQQLLNKNAQDIQILKKRTKGSYNLKDQEIQQDLKKYKNHKIYCKYLNFVKVRKNHPQISEQQQLSAFKVRNEQKFIKQQGKKFYTIDQECRCKYNALLNFHVTRQQKQKQEKNQKVYNEIDEYFFQQLIHCPQFQQLVPIHKFSKYKIEGRVNWYKQSIKQYLGANIQVYFDFVSHLEKWLIFPAIVGLLTIFGNYYLQYTADDSPLDSIYAFIITLWSVFWITSWQKHQKWLQVKNNNAYNSNWAFHQKLVVHKKQASSRDSEITGQKQIYHSLINLIYLYLRSSLILIIPIFISIIFLVISLNMRGFIDPNHQLLYWQRASKWAEKGGLFDQQTNWAWIPVLIHALVTNGIDQIIYRPLAIYTTKLQMHLEYKTYQNSIILKYFIYQMLITFVDLFYIAFIRFDIMGLKQQMVSLFFVDVVRRVVAETLLPYLKNKINTYNYKRQVLKKSLSIQLILEKQAFIEVQKASYEPFDDYLQIVTNFGYLVMLSSCFPAAPFLILVSHLIQIIHDKYKILFIYKKTLPTKFQGIGFWRDLLVFICYASIITNIILFAFSSHQIVGFFPKIYDSGINVVLGKTDITTFMTQAVYNFTDILYSQDKNLLIQNTTHCSSDPYHMFQQTKSAMLMSFVPPVKQQQSHFVIVLFVIEHIFIMIFVGIRKILKSQKNLADIFNQRRNYKRSIKAKMTKNKLIKKINSQTINKEQTETSLFKDLTTATRNPRQSKLDL